MDLWMQGLHLIRMLLKKSSQRTFKIIFLFSALILSGCATVNTRLERQKDKNINTTEVTVNCDVQTAKKISKEAIKEFNLVERPQLERDNFIFANTGYGDYWLSALFAPAYFRIGCFFKNNEPEKSTTIFITEEKLVLSNPIRHSLSDRIKVKSLDYNKLSKNK